MNKEEIFSKSQNSETVWARQTLFYLCKKRGLTTQMIQQYMENNGLKFSRSPITYGIKVIDSLLKDGDDDFQKVIDKLSRVD
tara:strand:+ start:91 stop:336 length:246 start_codon:yes stop_codon:yes gene_type:complete